MLVNGRQRTRAWLEDRSSISDVRAAEKEWLAIWKVKVPAKIRVFLWRLARHSLQPGDVLHPRSMATQKSCGLCGEPDSWKHAILECNLAKCVWALEREEVVESICTIQEKGWLTELFSTHSFVDRFMTDLGFRAPKRKEGAGVERQQTVATSSTWDRQDKC
jgi:hypothetical protein